VKENEKKYFGIKFLKKCPIDKTEECISEAVREGAIPNYIFIDKYNSKYNVITYSVPRNEIIKEGLKKSEQKKPSGAS